MARTAVEVLLHWPLEICVGTMVEFVENCLRILIIVAFWGKIVVLFWGVVIGNLYFWGKVGVFIYFG